MSQSERPTSTGTGVETRGGRGSGIDAVVFGVAAVAALAFLGWGLSDREGLGNVTTDVLAWVTENLGWLFVLSSSAFVIFAVVLALSRYGRIRLGPDDAKPEFSTFSWISMMFATGMGIGLMFYGVAEPLTHLNAPPLGEAEPGSPEAAQLSMQYTFFHWGFHPWAMYAVIGLCIAYFAYRKGRGNLISSAFYPLIGERASQGPGKAIDVLAIFATLVGSATSLGLGALQMTGGIDNVFGEGDGSKTLAIGVIAVLTGCFVVSAVSGIDRGVKWLSNANATAAALLVLFLFVVGPTVFILSTFTESMGAYLTQLPSMSFSTGVFENTQAEWINGWTIFYWAWWISWTPFVGMFIARISKGRTIREFVAGVLIAPSLVSFLWFSILGGSAFSLQLEEGVDMNTVLTQEGVEGALFETLREFPLGAITVALAVFLIAIFYITGADSASIVMGMLSQRGDEHPKRWLVVFWGVATGAVAAIMLSAGEEGNLGAGLEALQTLVIIVAAPFLLVLIAMAVALVKALREESFESTISPRMRKIVEHAGNGRQDGTTTEVKTPTRT